MAYETMGKDITEPSEVMDTKRPAKPKLEKPSPPLPTSKPPALAKDVTSRDERYDHC